MAEGMKNSMISSHGGKKARRMKAELLSSIVEARKVSPVSSNATQDKPQKHKSNLKIDETQKYGCRCADRSCFRWILGEKAGKWKTGRTYDL